MTMAISETMAGYSIAAEQLGLQRLALFQVVGEAFQHRAERAALFAGRDHGAIDVVELARRAAPARARRAPALTSALQVRDAVRAGAVLRLRRPVR